MAKGFSTCFGWFPSLGHRPALQLVCPTAFTLPFPTMQACNTNPTPALLIGSTARNLLVTSCGRFWNHYYLGHGFPLLPSCHIYYTTPNVYHTMPMASFGTLQLGIVPALFTQFCRNLLPVLLLVPAYDSAPLLLPPT